MCGGEVIEIMSDLHSAERLQVELLHRIAAQDREALAEIYDQLAGVLFSMAVRMLSDGHDAEEVIQDVFVQVWQKAGSFDEALGAPLHWTLSITRNRCIDRLRARHRRARLIEEMVEDAAAEPRPGGASHDPSLRSDEWSAVRSALAGLPEDQRGAIELAFFGGLTHPQIAEKLDQPLGTIKARIRRGMLKLRENLQAYL